ncbi:hypothetical protein P7K49_002115 [Saguinus oedipus]|uniref:Uncharacterized protein n=1 Tax=Saguinus oedipus TaxID=9490 RepID=A0ABQ9WIE1_SAGOE|nr:hypothetical protein P7K49_002115 [Saguinus oedipus]
MKVFLLSTILALLWVPTAQAKVLLQPDFNATKVRGASVLACDGWELGPCQRQGLWYVVSMASDCKVFLGKKNHLPMSTRAIKATEEGGLHVRMEFLGADGCNQVDAEYLKVGSKGHFRVPGALDAASLGGHVRLTFHPGPSCPSQSPVPACPSLSLLCHRGTGSYPSSRGRPLGYLDVRVVDTDYSSFAIVYIYKELEGALSTMRPRPHAFCPHLLAPPLITGPASTHSAPTYWLRPSSQDPPPPIPPTKRTRPSSQAPPLLELPLPSPAVTSSHTPGLARTRWGGSWTLSALDVEEASLPDSYGWGRGSSFPGDSLGGKDRMRLEASGLQGEMLKGEWGPGRQPDHPNLLDTSV